VKGSIVIGRTLTFSINVSDYIRGLLYEFQNSHCPMTLMLLFEYILLALNDCVEAITKKTKNTIEVYAR
jgi:hypothetical protein